MGGLLLFNSLRAMIYKFYWERPDGQGHVYDEKFIIAVVEDQEGESEIHFVTIPLAYHSDIFGSYKMKLEANKEKLLNLLWVRVYYFYCEWFCELLLSKVVELFL